MLDYVLQRFAVDVAAKFFKGDMHGAYGEVRAGTADVCGDESVGAVPERVSFGERFGVCDVKGGTDAAGGECGYQCIGVDDGTARGVDDERALLHESDATCVEEVVSFICGWKDEDDDFCERDEGVKFQDGVNLLAVCDACGAGDTCEFNVEWSEEAFDLLTDGAVADEEHAFAGELLLHDGRNNFAVVVVNGGI